MLGDDVSQELNLVLAQGALVCIHYQTILEEALEQDVEVVEVFLFVLGGNQDVIQVDEKEIQVPQYHVHQPLESLC